MGHGSHEGWRRDLRERDARALGAQGGAAHRQEHRAVAGSATHGEACFATFDAPEQRASPLPGREDLLAEQHELLGHQEEIQGSELGGVVVGGHVKLAPAEQAVQVGAFEQRIGRLPGRGRVGPAEGGPGSERQALHGSRGDTSCVAQDARTAGHRRGLAEGTQRTEQSRLERCRDPGRGRLFQGSLHPFAQRHQLHASLVDRHLRRRSGAQHADQHLAPVELQSELPGLLFRVEFHRCAAAPPGDQMGHRMAELAEHAERLPLANAGSEVDPLYQQVEEAIGGSEVLRGRSLGTGANDDVQRGHPKSKFRDSRAVVPTFAA